ncbi:MAG: ATP-binding protein [Prolixibacteraceae bacterium]|nr:ATP-binding protein [Prolixibacteraceae bacterium]
MTTKRNITKAIRFLLGKYPVIALTGPRQSGKTTLLKTMFPDYRYVSLENPDARQFAESDPNGFLTLYDKQVVFDEVQRVPALFSYIQTIVDESKIMGQYILSGSQNFHLMENISQSLAGRVALFNLFPFDFNELAADGLLNDDYLSNMLRGFYPAIYDRDIPPKIFYSNYIQTYVQRDVTELLAIKDMRMFQNFIGLCATRAGQLLNLNALANECGISQPTAKSWLSALESSYIVFQLSPYYKNFSKRIIKTPKLYFYDTGLLLHLLKINTAEQLLTHPVKGSLFENLMISELLKQMHHANMVHDIYFWRDSAGHKIDLLADMGTRIKITEMKAGMTIMPEMFKALEWFETNTGLKNLDKVLVYGGHQAQKRSAGAVVPWNNIGELVSL